MKKESFEILQGFGTSFVASQAALIASNVGAKMLLNSISPGVSCVVGLCSGLYAMNQGEEFIKKSIGEQQRKEAEFLSAVNIGVNAMAVVLFMTPNPLMYGLFSATVLASGAFYYLYEVSLQSMKAVARDHSGDKPDLISRLSDVYSNAVSWASQVTQARSRSLEQQPGER